MRRIDPDGDQERPSGAHLGCSCVCRPAAAEGPPSALDLDGGPWPRPKAARLARAHGRAALRALFFGVAASTALLDGQSQHEEPMRRRDDRHSFALAGVVPGMGNCTMKRDPLPVLPSTAEM